MEELDIFESLVIEALAHVPQLYYGTVYRNIDSFRMALSGRQGRFNDNDFVFLGYPDFGTMNIFTGYWGSSKSFRSMFTRVTAVPYKECLSYGAPYTGESILKDIKKILIDFKPTKIFLTLPVDTNPDHRSIYLFLR